MPCYLGENTYCGALTICLCARPKDVESYDPVLNPVLNREVRRTGGRVLITLGDQDIDLSPSFVIFLSTRDPTVRNKASQKSSSDSTWCHGLGDKAGGSVTHFGRWNSHQTCAPGSHSLTSRSPVAVYRASV